jgi:hypothetical protein
MLWLSDWVNGGTIGWHPLLPGLTLTSLDTQLSNGGWAILFFAENRIVSTEKLAPFDPIQESNAEDALYRLGADAVIWSWYDDREWLIAVRGSLE